MKKMKKDTKMGRNSTLGIGLVVIVVLAGIYFLFFTQESSTEIPSYVTGEMKQAYEWAKTEEGAAVLEQIPCYCGCKYEGHLHARHCFWRDDGTFDKHGITCSVCLDIAVKVKKMHEEGSDICEIRKAIDTFYEPNKHLGTDTPLPAGCSV